MNFKGRNITLHDMCLRDGMHPKQHHITVDEMVDIAGALDAARVPLIEVTHGDGLGGASVNYGFPRRPAMRPTYAPWSNVSSTLRSRLYCSQALVRSIT